MVRDRYRPKRPTSRQSAKANRLVVNPSVRDATDHPPGGISDSGDQMGWWKRNEKAEALSFTQPLHKRRGRPGEDTEAIYLRTTLPDLIRQGQGQQKGAYS